MNEVIIRGNFESEKYIKKTIKCAIVLFLCSIIIGVLSGFHMILGREEQKLSIFFSEILDTGVIFALPAIVVGVFAIVLSKMMENLSLEVTETRVTGRANFGRRVDLPIKHISAVGESMFGGIAIGTSAGKIRFYALQNRDEVSDAIRQVLDKTSE